MVDIKDKNNQILNLGDKISFKLFGSIVEGKITCFPFSYKAPTVEIYVDGDGHYVRYASEIEKINLGISYHENPNIIIAKRQEIRLETSCRTCKKPNDIGTNSCWWCGNLP